jgi:hypothetical protein
VSPYSLKTDETMTIPQPIRKFSFLAPSALLVAALAACSRTDDAPGSGGAEGNAGAPATAGSGNGDAGSSSANTAGSGNTAGSNGAAGTSASSDAIVGTFQIQALVDEMDVTTGITKVVGQVGDGPVPSNVVWTVKKTDGDCVLETPAAPFCEEPCGADVCVGDNECQAYPTGHSVGTVTLSGVNTTAGGAMVTLKEIAKAYQPPAGTSFVYPPFAAGDDIKLQATGGDYTAFELAAKGVDPIAFTNTDFALDEGKPFDITWDAAADAKAAQIYVKIDISHHGGIRGMIECHADDTGSLRISGETMTELIGLGVAGYPSVVLVRQSIDTAQIAPGRVRLEVSSRAERYLTVAGVDSCTVNEDCPDGKTCRTTDSTCQ